MPDFNPESILSEVSKKNFTRETPDTPRAKPVPTPETPRTKLVAAGEKFIQSFLDTLAPCDLYDFSKAGVFHFVFSSARKAKIGQTDDNNRIIDSSELELLAKELKWRLRYNQLYRSNIARDTFRANVIRLARSMRSSEIDLLNMERLSYLAGFRLEELKGNGTVGECYEIQSIHRVRLLSTWKEMVPVSAESQAKIDRLFRLSLENQRPPPNPRETEILQAGFLTREEMAELRAIRKATELFENATFLKNDYAGGLINNIRSELLGGRQLVCSDETGTYTNFLMVLARRGLLRHFIPGKPIDRPNRLLGGHQAASIYNRRTGETYVLDSWHEPGGTAAHITTRKNWLNCKDYDDAVAVIEE